MRVSSKLKREQDYSQTQVISSVALLFLLSIVLYSNLFVSEFIWDSRNVILEDPSVRDFKYLPSVLSEGFFEHIPVGGNNTTTMPYYRPLVKALHILEFSVFGKSPLGYKIFNAILNGLIVIIAFLLILKFTNNIRIAFVASLLYAVNPIRVESVAWVYSDSSLLLAFFALLSLYLFHKEKYAFSLVMYGLALLSRETAVLLPAILLLHAWLFPSYEVKKSYIKIIPFVVLSGVYLVMRQSAVGSIPTEGVEFLSWFNTSAVLLSKYLKILFVPDAPVTVYTDNFYQSSMHGVLLAYSTVVVVLLSGIYCLTDKKYLFWYLWIFVWLSVAFSPGIVAGTGTDYVLTEKALHLSLFGLCVLLATAASRGSRFTKPVAWVVILTLIPYQIASTYERTNYWKSTTALLEKAVEFNRDCYLCRSALAGEYSNKGQYKKALFEYDEMKRINPKRFALTYSYNDYGNLYYLEQKFDQAIKAWKQAIVLNPSQAEPYYNLWMVLKQTGKEQEATEYYRRYMLVKAQASAEPVIELQPE